MIQLIYYSWNSIIDMGNRLLVAKSGDMLKEEVEGRCGYTGVAWGNLRWWTVLHLDVVGSLQEATHMTKLQRTYIHTHTSAWRTREIWRSVYCTNVSFPILLLYYSYARWQHWSRWRRVHGTFACISLQLPESKIISKFKWNKNSHLSITSLDLDLPRLVMPSIEMVLQLKTSTEGIWTYFYYRRMIMKGAL